MLNTVKLTASAVVLSMLLGIGLVVLLDKQFFGLLLNWALSPFGGGDID